MIAAHSYVSDVLIGDTVKENSHEKQLQKDWRESLYQRVGVQLLYVNQAHPEDAEDLHVICDLLSHGVVMLDGLKDVHNEKEGVSEVIRDYDRLKGIESGMNLKRV